MIHWILGPEGVLHAMEPIKPIVARETRWESLCGGDGGKVENPPGGAPTCATCHMRVRERWLGR